MKIAFVLICHVPVLLGGIDLSSLGVVESRAQSVSARAVRLWGAGIWECVWLQCLRAQRTTVLQGSTACSLASCGPSTKMAGCIVFTLVSCSCRHVDPWRLKGAGVHGTDVVTTMQKGMWPNAMLTLPFCRVQKQQFTQCGLSGGGAVVL